MDRDITIGMDLGDRSHFCVVFNEQGEEVECVKVSNTKVSVMRYFECYRGSTVAVEAGTHSAWVSRLLEDMGCQVYVGNPRRLRLIWDSEDKSDERDARVLGLVCRLEPRLLWPVSHRDVGAHRDLETIKARDVLVQSRTRLINHIRSVVKGVGERLPKCSAASFSSRCAEHVPAELREALEPLFKTLDHLKEMIRELDRKIDMLCRERYPETQRLMQVPGVGPVTALAYVLTIDDPGRFDKSRHIGSYLGLTPRRDQSGQIDKQLRISKTGNRYLRQLLVNCSHYVLGPFGPDSDLRRFGLSIARRGGKNAKKRAAVAVARKLSVLLHRLWISGEPYQLFYRPPMQKAA
jgi:transposase